MPRLSQITRRVTERGYIELRSDTRDHRGRLTWRFEHDLVAEKALGHALPPGAVVHHVNEVKTDNHRPFNLVICEDQAYHLLLHRRAKALAECGDANAKQCRYCKGWGLPSSFDGCRRGQYYHRPCAADWQQKHRDRRRGSRPKHLELVSARPTCKHGHPWTHENTRWNAKGCRWCLDCSRAADARRRTSA